MSLGLVWTQFTWNTAVDRVATGRRTRRQSQKLNQKKKTASSISVFRCVFCLSLSLFFFRRIGSVLLSRSLRSFHPFNFYLLLCRCSPGNHLNPVLTVLLYNSVYVRLGGNCSIWLAFRMSNIFIMIWHSMAPVMKHG
jgi:hypothetical protein